MNSKIVLFLKAEDKKLLIDFLSDLRAVVNAKEIRDGEFKVEFVCR